MPEKPTNRGVSQEGSTLPDPTNPIEEPSGRRWTITPCPDCGNHETAFSLCEHQQAAFDIPDVRADYFPEVEVISLADHEQVVRELRKALDPVAQAPPGALVDAYARIARSALARTGGQTDD